MNRESLEKIGLNEDQITEVQKLKSNDIKEREKLENDLKVANETIKTLNENIKEHDAQLETLKNSKLSSDELQAQIETLQTQNQEKELAHAKEIEDLKKNFAIEKALINAGAINNKAIMPFLNLDNLKLQDDGTVKGLDEQIGNLKIEEGTKFLFKAEEEPKKEFKGATPGESGQSEPATKVDFSQMSYEEIAKYYEEQKNQN